MEPHDVLLEEVTGDVISLQDDNDFTLVKKIVVVKDLIHCRDVQARAKGGAVDPYGLSISQAVVENLQDFVAVADKLEIRVDHAWCFFR